MSNDNHTTSNSDIHRQQQQQQAVVSVLRQSGSFASLQIQKNMDSPSSPREPRQTKVTVIHTNDLPNYSTERYYMLSEIQLKAHSTIFLRDLFPLRGDGQGDDDDYDNDDHTHDLSLNSSSLESVTDENNAKDTIKMSNRHHVDASEEKDNRHNNASSHDDFDIPPQGLPNYILLYLLWRPDCIHTTPEAYAKQVVKIAVDQIFQLYNKNQKNDDCDKNSCDSDPFIYLVIDRLVYNDGCASAPHDIASCRESEIAISEQLIRTIATDSDINLRSIIQGVTVGLSDDFRAAPGLETCMDSILVGDAERRHYGLDSLSKKKSHDLTIVRNRRELDPSRSCIGIVTEYPDDLLGIGPLDETDAAQNLSLHARSTGNWSGKGSHLNFAARAQQHWRKLWNYECWEIHHEFALKSIGNEYSILRKRKKKRQEDKNEEESSMMHYLPSRRLKERTERTADMMVIGFLAFAATILW
eukprot:CAMPEP_0176483722 /NCGR_PEP_ID=MMETSP0200_2-20121128/4070_1 /TAXON_ID=947934 /ORGANISM="Chaetoceros sp., Strain GSL56" /LENGTH=469 /DNA_ID=CAMNT_0017880143 /DNA_START=218 /DNA_END=1624 /DNA_ORIENTATION=-